MSYLYVFQADDGPVKIGISSTPAFRAKTLECAMGRQITRRFVSEPIQNPRAIEQQLHRHFSSRRGIGEWFAVEFDEAVSAAKAMLAPVETLRGAGSIEVARAVELLGLYRELKDAGLGDVALAGFSAALSGDDVLALVVTARAMALDAIEAAEVVAQALDDKTLARAAELTRGSASLASPKKS